MGRFPEQETCLFLALGASPSLRAGGPKQWDRPWSISTGFRTFFFPELFLFIFPSCLGSHRPEKAMKRIGMRKKSSMHFIVLKVCKSQNKKEK